MRVELSGALGATQTQGPDWYSAREPGLGSGGAWAGEAQWVGTTHGGGHLRSASPLPPQHPAPMNCDLAHPIRTLQIVSSFASLLTNQKGMIWKPHFHEMHHKAASPLSAQRRFPFLRLLLSPQFANCQDSSVSVL